ncbi:hypothetical protein M089_1646 [Bacteroides ovatus str. 3725 D9 iii]|uniref:Uncharacterized protein n=1 Tax=Bacteroides ovatus (strain ATCC 8483 / DSM 1896 / JCM 5824 / BCRC 10623 / CCUG 4943 / NCTC 11153) TaxID=411476 RepID=A0AAN3D684_BACO1|nr:hypothetical protein BACOVA_04527 [Bacteroides ovatus ATCC 8483]KDS12806.1 hypothetical protein M088_3020 [Bacteroides ovatus str. 3725 D1 iv]KDS18390.1 hypothetical protein M082_3398 [Bacteroides fragilis str. 3725 D9 ii]KDS43982.1 hypothetical protein M089_1646 [Bacteroides ovatus str. 3725 D9 iii]CAG9869495.1 hypothetical protein BOVAC1_3850 [Bacteroides ovatus]
MFYLCYFLKNTPNKEENNVLFVRYKIPFLNSLFGIRMEWIFLIN